MQLLSRAIFREVASSALLGTFLFTFVLFLQRVGRLFEILVRSSAPPPTVGYLFALAIPFTLTFTLPLGVLVGVLIALSRMSSDGEITAMRAAGVPSRKVIAPVLLFATLSTLVTAAASLWLTPYATWRTYKVLNQLVAAELTAEVQPRVFEEQFPNRVLYVSDVIPGSLTRWRNVFIADTSAPDQQPKQDHERGEGPRVTVASEAIAVPDVTRNVIQLSLQNGATYEVGKNITDYYITSAPKGEQILEATKPNEVHAKGYTEIDTIPLYRSAYNDPALDRDSVIQARIELHQRLALPPACFLLALIGIPLGVSSRKGGKSSAFVVTVAVAFIYWMGLIGANGLAKQQKLPVGVAMWMPNAVFALAAIILLARLERPGDRDWMGLISAGMSSAWRRLRGSLTSASALAARGNRRSWRNFLVPQVVDTYVLHSFLFYFALLLISFVLMTHVYTFFELLSDIVKNHIAMSRVLTYLLFLTPELIYELAPLAVLVAVLITFGILTKHNEVTAFKACGISLYRLAVPVLAAAVLLSGGLFAFDHYYVPGANRIQDAIRKEIKGKPVQTYVHPERQWVFNPGSKNDPRIFYYKYLDPGQKLMVGPQVYELDPADFRIRRHIAAERARWEPTLGTWIFENGWSRDFFSRQEKFNNFSGQATTFKEINERPDYFLQEVLQDQQMNFQQLAAYIGDLQRSGIDTITLQVRFYRKFALPLFALVMALISIPFGFMAGNRGAMAGVGVSFSIAIAYWALGKLFEQLGDINLLPAALAAWSPDVLFATAGMYFFSRLRT
jgi:LPS export ABC transporter permease LptG/LPS export ABC transporter permease LptF